LLWWQRRHAIVDFIIDDLSLLAPSSSSNNGSNVISSSNNGSNVVASNGVGAIVGVSNGSNSHPNGSNDASNREGAKGAELWERLELLRFMVEL